MSENNPAPQEEEEEPASGLGPMGFGVLLGAPALYALYFVAPIIFGGPYLMRFLTGPATFIPIAVYLVAAIVLAVRPRTSQLGAGLLIGLGIFALLGGGLCVGYLAQMRA
jgi:hypothetical protein